MIFFSNKCSHCDSTNLRVLRNGFVFPPDGVKALGIHGDLHKCEQCGGMTINGVSAQPKQWDPDIDAIPEIIKTDFTSYMIVELNPLPKLLSYLETQNIRV